MIRFGCGQPSWGAGRCLIIAVISQRLITLLRKQVSRDELIMIDLVNMQRALLPLLARDEEWSSAQSIRRETPGKVSDRA